MRPHWGCWFIRWPPQRLHHLRKLLSVLLKTPIWSAPSSTFTFSGAQSVNPLTGLALRSRAVNERQLLEPPVPSPPVPLVPAAPLESPAAPLVPAAPLESPAAPLVPAAPVLPLVP